MKKLTTLLASLMIMTSVVPMNSVLKANLSNTASVYAAEIYETGKCGENLTWTLDYDGNLTISGKGDMYDYNSITGYSTPFSAAQNVVIEDGVTSIGDGAFMFCENLTEIVLPNSIKSIGAFAFKECNISEIVISDAVTTIGNCSFQNCKMLENVVIPDSVEKIGGRAFDGTPWLEKKQKENPVVIINDNLIDGTTAKGEVDIPDNIKYISEAAFYQADITSAVIPDGVETIDFGTFVGCKNLKSVTIPESVGFIYNKNDGSAFFGCDNLKNIKGYKGSYAEEYALKNDIPFIVLDEETANVTGDANCDGEVNMADATLVMQLLANPDKYGVKGTDDTHITEKGMGNADVNGGGVTNTDALDIQKFILKEIDGFVSEK